MPPGLHSAPLDALGSATHATLSKSDSLAPAQHLQIARLRAIETGRMHLTATNTRITAAVDRDGRVVGRLAQFAEGRLEVRAQGYSGRTPYMTWADWPVVLGSLALLAGAVLLARRRIGEKIPG